MASHLAAARDRWWVIGSAAVALHGGITDVADIDVLVSQRDARTLLDRLYLRIEPGVADERFRSAIFSRWSGAPLPIEFMAGFDYREDGRWRPVRLASRIVVDEVPVPARRELAALLRRFGRPKDVDRAALLDAIS